MLSAGTMMLLHLFADQEFAAHERNRNDYFVPSASVVKLCALGFDQVLADMYWLAFIQYIGELDPRRGDEYRKTYSYVDLITELDPHFLRPYWFGSWSIGYWQKRPDLADKILQRGIAANPDEWELPFLAGVNAYIFGDDYTKAAKYYRQAARLPGAAPYLEKQAVILESDAYPLVKRKHTLYSLIDSTKNEEAKAAYRQELVGTLVKLYYTAPTDKIRDEAKLELVPFGVDVSKLPPVPVRKEPKEPAGKVENTQ
jgi:tetratricopeptide (TPR) repeat protein